MIPTYNLNENKIMSHNVTFLTQNVYAKIVTQPLSTKRVDINMFKLNIWYSMLLTQSYETANSVYPDQRTSMEAYRSGLELFANRVCQALSYFQGSR